MAWRIVQQPNGLFARFSEIVDDFTAYHMTREEAEQECRRHAGMGEQEAKEKVQRGIDAGQPRFAEAIEIVRAVHGRKAARDRKRELSKPVSEERS